MVFTLPPIDTKVDAEGNEVPNFDYISGKLFSKSGNIRDTERAEKKFELLNIFDLPLILILKNIANTLMAVISELTMARSYSSIYAFLKVFIRNNRLMYIGMVMVFMSLFLSFFFV